MRHAAARWTHRSLLVRSLELEVACQPTNEVPGSFDVRPNGILLEPSRTRLMLEALELVHEVGDSPCCVH